MFQMAATDANQTGDDKDLQWTHGYVTSARLADSIVVPIINHLYRAHPSMVLQLCVSLKENAQEIYEQSKEITSEKILEDEAAEIVCAHLVAQMKELTSEQREIVFNRVADIR